LAPNNVNAISHFGVVPVHLGQPEAAIPHIERCLRLAPHDRTSPGNHALLGLCKLLLGNIEEAIIILRRSRSGNPRLYFVHLFLAAALALRGEQQEAGDTLRQAVETRPDLCSQADLKSLLRECSPEYIKLYRKTVYAGLLLAGISGAAPSFAPLPEDV
jgi:adenylate cyclase